jgi:hypothetical protein
MTTFNGQPLKKKILIKKLEFSKEIFTQKNMNKNKGSRKVVSMV